MSTKRQKTRYIGVYAREHESRQYKGGLDVCYYISYRLPGGNRKLIWEKVGCLSEGVTALKASQVRSQRLMRARNVDNLPADNERLTLKDAFNHLFTEYLKHNRKRPQDAVSIYETRIKPVLGELPLSSITPVEVDDLIKGLSNLSPQSIRHTLNVLGQIYRHEMRYGRYDGPIPTDNAMVVKIDGRRMRFLSKSEAKILMSALHERSLTLWQMALISLYTGLRAGEIFLLRWEHINIVEGTITVMDSKNSLNRVVYMPDQVKDMLAKHKSTSNGQEGRLLFPKSGTPNTPRRVLCPTFSTVVRDLKLNEGRTDPRDKVVFHTLRHTFASWLVQSRVPIFTVKELMGHKCIRMTLRYAHLSPEQGAEAARLLSAISLDDH